MILGASPNCFLCSRVVKLSVIPVFRSVCVLVLWFYMVAWVMHRIHEMCTIDILSLVFNVFLDAIDSHFPCVK